MCQVRPDCHNPKGKVKARANKDMVDTWATRCMVSRAPNTAEAQEGWVVHTISLEDRAIKPVVTVLMGLVTAQDSMEIAVGAGGVPIMGTKI